MNDFTATSEVMELDELDENLVIKNIQKVLVKIADENTKDN